MGEDISAFFGVRVPGGVKGSGSDFVGVFKVCDLGEGGPCIVVEVAFLPGEVFLDLGFSVSGDVVFEEAVSDQASRADPLGASLEGFQAFPGGCDDEGGVAVSAEAFPLLVPVSDEALDLLRGFPCLGGGVDVGVEDGDLRVGLVGEGGGGWREELNVEPWRAAFVEALEVLPYGLGGLVLGYISAEAVDDADGGLLPDEDVVLCPALYVSEVVEEELEDGVAEA